MGLMLKNIAYPKQSTNVNHLILVVSLLGFIHSEVLGQSNSYQVQIEDRLQISFWENPELNTQVTVGKDGEIELPIVGRLTAARVSIKQLREKIISEMALYNKLVTQLSISVLEYGHNRVYITGQVGAPGRYAFEDIPNLWEIIREAGGPLETALLDEVVIVRSEEDGKVFTVDLSDALRRARISELPKMLPGDTIYVPGATEDGTSPSPLVRKDEIHAPLVRKDEIHVWGAIALPGAHKFEANQNLLEVISKAGGPTENANLKNVKHVSVSHGTIAIAEVNLEEYINTSTPVPMPIRAGDTIVIPRREGLSPIATTVISTLITGIITTTIAVIVVR